MTHVIQGTVDEIVRALVDDLKMSEMEAQTLVYLEIKDKQERTKNVIFSDEELKSWFLRKNVTQTAQILNKPLSITYSDVKKVIYSAVFSMAGKLINGDLNSENAPKELTKEALKALWDIFQRIKKIEYDDFCVFERIVEKTFKAGKDEFTREEIIPYTEKGTKNVKSLTERICDRKPEEWKCIHRHDQDDACTVDVDACLNNLEEMKIIKKKDSGWSVVR